MPHAIAFFPWIIAKEPLKVGPIRFIPYQRNKYPGDSNLVKQTEIDGVLHTYANRPRNHVKHATLIEFGNWRSGMDADAIAPQLFRARDAIAFAAIANRRPFSRLNGYCNYDSYELVIQRYDPGHPGRFVFTTRRRDGATTQFWTSDEFAFHRPAHVDSPSYLDLDVQLLEALVSLPHNDQMFEAVVEFNCANTDSRAIPEHVEVVMVKSAFEWLLGVGPEANDLVLALSSSLESIVPSSPDKSPMKDKWYERWSRAARPLEAWARDFCLLRGVSAHGGRRNASKAVWPAHTHLLFAAFFFPLLLKKTLSTKGLMTLNTFDLERLKLIDHYLCHDPFGFDWDSDDKTHPWVELDMEARIQSSAHLFYPPRSS